MAEEQELTPEEKLLKVIQKGEPKEDAPARMPDSVPEESGAADLVVAGEPKEWRALTICNRVLTLAAVLFLLLAGYESYLNFPTQAVAYPDDDLRMQPLSSSPAPATLSDTEDMFSKRRIFGIPPPTVTTTQVTNVVMIGWRAYVRENYSLIGMSNVRKIQDGVEQSQMEAIVMDNKLKKMQFLTEGNTLVISEQEVLVSRIGDSAIELKFGEETLTLE